MSALRYKNIQAHLYSIDKVMCVGRTKMENAASISQIPSSPLQDVAGVDTAPVTAEITAGETHVWAWTPAAICGTLPITRVVAQSWKQAHNLKKGSFLHTHSIF